MARRQVVRRLVASLALAGLCTPALADPVSAALAIASAVTTAIELKVLFLIAAYAYGSARARSEKRNAEAKARAAYNASLADRNVTVLRADPPWRIIYGRTITGGDIVSVFTQDKTALDDGGATYTKKDAYKHLLVHFASHQCQALNEIYLDGKPVGIASLSSGWSTVAEFSKTRKVTRSQSLGVGAAVTFPYSGAVLSFIQQNPDYSTMADIAFTLTNGNKTVTNTGGVAGWLIFIMDEPVSSVHISYGLGTPTQAADAWLLSQVPSKWTSNHRLRGRMYAVITLDLEDRRFQGGPPQITADISGRLVLDTRTGTTAWSDNPALCLRDYLTAPWGPGSVDADVDTTYTNAAANACDATVTARKKINGVSTTPSQKKYTFNGVITTDQAKESTIDEFADAMAGWCTNASQWLMGAGVWTAPVLALTEADLDGQIEIVQGDAPYDETFNGVRGQYIPKGTSTPVDYTPYKNAAFITADGKPLWKNKTLPFTDDPFIATTIARIITERGRNGQVIKFPAKLKALGLQIGDRVTVTSVEHGWTTKPYRVTDWQFTPKSPVDLVLQEDASAAYDLSDEVNADATPNTGLPNPWAMPDVGTVTLLSDQTTLRRQSDGAVAPRIKASWPQYTGPYVNDGGGYIWVKYQRAYRDGVGAWVTLQLPGNTTTTYIEGVTDGDRVTVGVWATNGAGGISNTAFATVTVVGKTSAPSNVAGLTAVPAPGQINLSWTDASAEVGYENTEVRVGASLGASTRVFIGKASSFIRQQSTPALETFWVRHVDSWGNLSASAASVTSTSLSLSADNNWDFSNGTTSGWTGVSSIGTDSGASGGKYGIHNGSLGLPAYGDSIPIDPSRTYRVTVRFYVSGGAGGPVYAGVIPLDSAGAQIANGGGAGTFPYCAIAGQTPPGANSTWVVASGLITGAMSAPTADTAYRNTFPSGTVRAAPFIMPYTGFAGSLFIDYVIIEDVTDTILADAGGFVPWRTWDFNSPNAEGWTAGGATLTSSGSELVITSTGTDPVLRSPALSFYGGNFDKVRMMVRRTAGVAWDGLLYYTTPGHGESGSYYRAIPSSKQPSAYGTLLEFDMGKQLIGEGGPDWLTSQITGIRIDLGTVNGDAFAIDWIAIGSGKPVGDLSAVSNSQWVARNVTIIGDRAIKTGGTHGTYDADVYTRETYLGGCAASASFECNSRACGFGLNSDPALNGDFASIDYFIVCDATNVIGLYESGSLVLAVGAASPTDLYTVSYDGAFVRYLKNGVALRTVAASSSLALYFDSAFSHTGSTINAMRFVPQSKVADIGASQISSLNADVINAGSIRGINVNAASHTTLGSYLTSAPSGGATTVNVKDTTDFPASGTAHVIDTTNDRDSFTYTGKTATTLTGCSGVLAHNSGATIVPLSGKSIVMDRATNEMRFYGDRGDGTIEELAAIGIQTDGSDIIIADFGSSGVTNRVAVRGITNTGTGVIGKATGGTAIYGENTGSTGKAGSFQTSSGSAETVRAVSFGSGTVVKVIASSGIGIDASGDSEVAARFAGNATRGAVELTPLAGRPSNRAAGQLAMINTTGGTTDARTGAPYLMYTNGDGQWRYVVDSSQFNG